MKESSELLTRYFVGECSEEKRAHEWIAQEPGAVERMVRLSARKFRSSASRSIAFEGIAVMIRVRSMLWNLALVLLLVSTLPD